MFEWNGVCYIPEQKPLPLSAAFPSPNFKVLSAFPIARKDWRDRSNNILFYLFLHYSSIAPLPFPANFQNEYNLNISKEAAVFGSMVVPTRTKTRASRDISKTISESRAFVFPPYKDLI